MGKTHTKTLLIVDDEKDLREIIVKLCKELTPNVLSAANGKDALQIIRSGQVDAVLTDINMPNLTGLQLLAEVRAMGLETPFVILTGYGDRANTTEALRLGATDFLDKPFDDATVLKILGKALDFGIALKEAEAQIELAFANSKLPADKLIRLKKAKKSIWMMRKGMEIYTNIKKAS
jgi:YesN/AraC family two-component response regulator